MGNLLGEGFIRWFRTRRWWILIIVYTVTVTGLTLLIASSEYVELPELAGNYCGVLGLLTALGAVITTHGAIIGEKRSGTAEWILSKPVSRTAFVLAKLVSSTVVFLILVIAVQGLSGYLVISIDRGRWLAPLDFVAGLGVISLHLLLYISLTIMLGTLINSRSAVIGIPVFLLFTQVYLVARYSWLGGYIPGALVIGPSVGESTSVLVMLGLPTGHVWPLAIAAILTVVFVAVALWRFGLAEF